MKNLLLTLGHNSSAVFVEDGRVVWGYETERLSGTKSDSLFPQAVLDHRFEARKFDTIYVTHWAPDGKLSSMSAKHWNPRPFDGVPIRTTSVEQSHHDTHMHAAKSYATSLFPREGSYGLVVDGFGNYGEHFSVYDLSGDRPKLLRRWRGYGTSLGLFYQYATAFMGMKMHEDEYKLLGYEVLVPAEHVLALDLRASVRVLKWLDDFEISVYKSPFDPLYRLDALTEAKAQVFQELSDVSEAFGIVDSSTAEARAILAYYVQRVLEGVVLGVVKTLPAKNLLVSGGVFYNVKLNKALLEHIPAEGLFCAYPLAGDQGNALGLYAMDYPAFRFPKDLFWGHRRLYNVGEVAGLVYVNSESQAFDVVMSKLRKPGHVNLVRGSMEFGPRALCHTSTLALPSSVNVRRINNANQRNTVMPMAPVLLRRHLEAMFRDVPKVWRSEEHMILAMRHLREPSVDIYGIVHGYQYPDEHFTSRPQVVYDDELMIKILEETGPLINTSFNFHGRPIAFDMGSIIENHNLQRGLDPSFQTVVITNE